MDSVIPTPIVRMRVPTPIVRMRVENLVREYPRVFEHLCKRSLLANYMYTKPESCRRRGDRKLPGKKKKGSGR